MGSTLLRRPVKACAQCGSPQLASTMSCGDGALLGFVIGIQANDVDCLRCGHRGNQIQFNSEKSRKAFEKKAGQKHGR